MEHIITRRRGFRKLLAFLLCMASILGLLPAQAFAMSVGQTASSWLGDQYVGSDGNHYRAPAPYTYLAYHADGTIDVHTSSGGNAYRHYMLTDSDGISHQVYCVESGIPYHTSENTYVSESGTNSQYLNLLPAEARRGITLTAIYGWKPGAALPVSGINEDDYKMATQIILWESFWNWRWPSWRLMLRCFLGGMLMGWGSLLIPGSNDGLILVGLPLLWSYAWVAVLVMCVTIWAAILAERRFLRP